MNTIRNGTRIGPSHLLGHRPQRTIALRWVGDEPRGTRAGGQGDERADDGCIEGRSDSNERSDGGTPEHGIDGDEGFRTYTDEKYGYRVAYPAGWSVETEPTGEASFGALVSSDAGAVVFVDEEVESLRAYVEEFVADLRADEHVHASEPMTPRDVRLESGQRGLLIECPYIGDTPTETLRLVYLFAVVNGTGYTLGVDWNDDEPLGDVATRVVESFAVSTGPGDDHSETGNPS